MSCSCSYLPELYYKRPPTEAKYGDFLYKFQLVPSTADFYPEFVGQRAEGKKAELLSYDEMRGLIGELIGENEKLVDKFDAIPSTGPVRWWHVFGFDAEPPKNEASREKIRRTYRRLSFFHPDKYSGDERYETLFQNITSAYEESQKD